jgi:Asp-tRNA(Asn)/Glu-tRNA(Gln) amidotransferase A subunit family amidase
MKPADNSNWERGFMSELHFKPAHELATMIRSKQIKASELMEVTLRRIEALNPKLNAFVAMRADKAVSEARAIDEKVVRKEEVGPFAGLPLGVKDLEDTVGLATTFGSKPFRYNIAKQDSVEVARLKAAGAIVVGKTNAPEFGATGFTRNLLFGVTRNPWNLERTPGGSSGGSSAAIASGMVPLATGSDGGGSIRIPACYTGTYGLKVTHGRIPNNPMLGMQGFIDTAVLGPLTRTVRDAAIFLDVCCGYDPVDPDSLPHPGISYAALLDRLPKRLRFAFHPDFGKVVQSDVAREVSRAVAVFKELGHEVSILDGEVPDTGRAWLRLGAGSSYAMLHEYIGDHAGDFGRSFIAGVMGATNVGWDKVGEAQRARTRFNDWVRGIFAKYDLLLTPTLPTEPFAAAGPPPSEINRRPIGHILNAVLFTYPFNLSGHPAASVRAGLTNAGLPCGLQIVAERYREDLVLQASYAYEQARPWKQWPVL